MAKNLFVHKKNSFISVVIEWCSLFVFTPLETTAHSRVKKYFSNIKVSDTDEIYSDWKIVGDDMRYALNEYKPIFQDEIKKRTPYNKKNDSVIAVHK